VSVRTFAKGALAAVVRFSGITALVRATIARRRVGILVYHDPGAALLEKHLEYLSRRYSFVTVEELVRALESDDWQSLPPHAVVLTFDDGHRTNVELIPPFERHGSRPTIYLCSGPITGSGRFWFREPNVDPEPLKRVPNDERVATLERLRASAPPATAARAERHALDRADLERMGTVVDFGSHSVSHPILPMCSRTEAENEIRQSRLDVARLTSTPCDHFSFPNGDYSERELELVRQAGYRSARTTDIGWNGRGADPYRLRIIGMPDVASVNVLAAQLGGVLFAKRLAGRLLRHRRRAQRRRRSRTRS
jgi:peptidoglycan/xylan/chitin deacetylase (PgdA/CDA1 family)